MAENVSKLLKETDIQAQESQSPKQDELKDIHAKIHFT